MQCTPAYQINIRKISPGFAVKLIFSGCHMMLHCPKVNFCFIRVDKLSSRFCSLPLIFLIRNKARIEGVRTRGLVFESHLQRKFEHHVLGSYKVLSLGFTSLIVMPILGFIQVLNTQRKWYRGRVLSGPKPKDLSMEETEEFLNSKIFKVWTQSCKRENS